MSHGKETPRQKMINLMYLILTCLLALNVSRDILTGFVNLNESIEKTNDNFSGSTQKMMEAFAEAIKQGHLDVKPYYEKAAHVKNNTDETVRYLDSLKKQVIVFTENSKGADTLKLGQTEKLDDYDRPTYFLLGDDELKPKSGRYSANELKQKLSILSDTLLKELELMHAQNGTRLPEKDYLVLRSRLVAFRPQADFKDAEGLPISWEMKNFYNQPMAAVVTNLSRLQGEIMNLQSEMIGVFAAASGKLAVRFNEMQAKLVPVSQYVQLGSNYKADVFLSASSSDFTSDNLQVVMGDVDTSSGKLLPGAVILPFENGFGKLTLPAASVGHKEVKGWIRLREGTGTYKYFPYSNKYVVANAAVAVSAEKMNVLYVGVENPVSVSAAGVAPEDLEVKVAGAGATIQNKGNGRYTVFVSGTGETTVSVFQRTDEGLKQQGFPQIFRVRKFPNPPVRISGQNINGNADFAVADARAIRRVLLDLSNIDFKAPFKIKSFAMVMGGGGQGFQFFKCAGDELSPDAVAALSRIRRGARIYIEDIKVQAPDGPRELPLVKITVK